MRVPIGARAGSLFTCRKKSTVILSNRGSIEIFVSADRNQLDAGVDSDGIPQSGTPLRASDLPLVLENFRGTLYGISMVPCFLEVEIQ